LNPKENNLCATSAQKPRTHSFGYPSYMDGMYSLLRTYQHSLQPLFVTFVNDNGCIIVPPHEVPSPPVSHWPMKGGTD